MAPPRKRENARAKTLVTGTQTGGRLALFEVCELAGHGPPSHVHAHEDETVYVLDGSLTFSVGDEVREAVAGSCVVLPQGIEHGYVVTSAFARLLVALTPAGMEGYFGVGTDGGGCDEVERLIARAARHGVTITGPPPSPREEP